MKYTVILTVKPNGGIRVSVPVLPNCTIEADNRDEALQLARETIAHRRLSHPCHLVYNSQQQEKTDGP